MFSNCWFRFIKHLGFQIDDYNSDQIVAMLIVALANTENGYPMIKSLKM